MLRHREDRSKQQRIAFDMTYDARLEGRIDTRKVLIKYGAKRFVAQPSKVELHDSFRKPVKNSRPP